MNNRTIKDISEECHKAIAAGEASYSLRPEEALALASLAGRCSKAEHDLRSSWANCEILNSHRKETDKKLKEMTEEYEFWHRKAGEEHAKVMRLSRAIRHYRVTYKAAHEAPDDKAKQKDLIDALNALSDLIEEVGDG